MTVPAELRSRWRFKRLPFIALFVAAAIAVAMVVISKEPYEAEPNPNGLTLLLTLSSNLDEDVKNISRTNVVERERVVRAHPELVHSARAALTNEMQSRRLRSGDDFPSLIRESINLRRLVHALSLVADTHLETGDKNSAADIFCLQFEIGCRCYRSGVAFQYLVGNAIETGALYDLNDLVPRLEPSASEEIARRLVAITGRRYPIERVMTHERKWMWFKTPWWKSIDGIKEAGASLFSYPGPIDPRDREKSFLTLQSNVVLRLELRGRGVDSLPAPIKVPMF